MRISAVAGQADFLAQHYFHQLRPLRPQRDHGHQFVHLRAVGFRPDLYGPGDVLASRTVNS
jgi:hypothetical protein